MNLPIVLTSDAEQEFDAAADWYHQQAGLGAQFITNVRDALGRIAHMPDLHAVVYRDIRCANVRRFPYNIYYRIDQERIEVIAILHGHRDPLTWKSRQ